MYRINSSRWIHYANLLPWGGSAADISSHEYMHHACSVLNLQTIFSSLWRQEKWQIMHHSKAVTVNNWSNGFSSARDGVKYKAACDFYRIPPVSPLQFCNFLRECARFSLQGPSAAATQGGSTSTAEAAFLSTISCGRERECAMRSTTILAQQIEITFNLMAKRYNWISS